MSAIWTNRFSVGNSVIDSAHKNILNIIFRISYIIGERDGAALKEAFKLLENSLCAYFQAEEKFAHAINIDFTQHKLAHQSLLNNFQNLRGILEERNGMWSDGEGGAFTNSLAKSFVQHVKDDGMQMKVVLETLDYDPRLGRTLAGDDSGVADERVTMMSRSLGEHLEFKTAT